MCLVWFTYFAGVAWGEWRRYLTGDLAQGTRWGILNLTKEKSEGVGNKIQYVKNKSFRIEQLIYVIVVTGCKTVRMWNLQLQPGGWSRSVLWERSHVSLHTNKAKRDGHFFNFLYKKVHRRSLTFAISQLLVPSRWSYHFFFYNRKLKRVVTFRFSCLR